MRAASLKIRGAKAKSVLLTDEGVKRSKALFENVSRNRRSNQNSVQDERLFATGILSAIACYNSYVFQLANDSG